MFFEAPHRIAETLRELHQVAGDCRLAVGRELTKTHEEFVRGSVSDVARQLHAARGELTVVAEIGETTEIIPVKPDLPREFGEMTVTPGISKRRAVAMLARRHGLAPNSVYEVLEAAKKSLK